MAGETQDAPALRFAALPTWDQEGRGLAVSVPAIEGCLTFGETVEVAVAMAEDAIRVNLEEMASRGEPLPKAVVVRVETVSVSDPQAR